MGTISCILFFIAMEPLNRLLLTAFLELMYTTDQGATAGPLLNEDDYLTPQAIEGKNQLPMSCSVCL
jgi:hypothetical protein